MRSHRLLAGSAALAWMLLAQPALGATVGVSTSSFNEPLLVYEAAVGEINDVSVVEAPDDVFMLQGLVSLGGFDTQWPGR